VNTPLGKVAAAICYDGDFPNFIRTAGRNQAEIMFLPANDWKAIDPIHTDMAIIRAIENGFSLVHPAGPGLSVASDSRGRIISSMDYYRTDEQIMYSDVPTQHAFTLYPLIGDLFAWLCIAGLATFLVAAIFKKYFLRVKGSYADSDARQKMNTRPDLA
jgi:apolipoprotein N-acyltransferase